MKRTGASANITYYRDGGTWVSVLCSTCSFRRDPETRELESISYPVPHYHVTIYRDGQGEVDDFLHVPERKPRGLDLSPRTVARLVGERAVAS